MCVCVTCTKALCHFFVYLCCNPHNMAAHAEVLRLANKEVVLVSWPHGLPKESDFAVVESELAFTRPLPPGSLLLKVLWISIDPYLRELLHQASPIAGIPAYEIGKPLYMVRSLSKVLASGRPDFEEGDIAYGVTSVSQYVICGDAAQFQKVSPNSPHIPLTHYLGVLGMPGLTAWVGINIITQLQPKEGIFISSAAGAVGLLVGQLAKLKGCYVVGSASSDNKVKLLKETFNFDDAFNYKNEEDLELALRRCFPNGLDVYFENVGGEMLEAVLEVINTNGRIIACGMISQYNKEGNERDGVKNLFNIVGKSLKMQGFLVTSYFDSWYAFHEEVIQLLQQGKINYTSDVLGRGIEEFPKALIGMLTSQNIGKAVLFVSDKE